MTCNYSLYRKHSYQQLAILLQALLLDQQTVGRKALTRLKTAGLNFRGILDELRVACENEGRFFEERNVLRVERGVFTNGQVKRI